MAYQFSQSENLRLGSKLVLFEIKAKLDVQSGTVIKRRALGYRYSIPAFDS